MSEEDNKKNKEKDNRDSVHQPHDTAFKNTFSNKKTMLDFLAANLPSELFSKIDQENLELTNKSFMDPVGRRGESDLVFKTNINGQSGYLYCLCEHQATEDPYMPLRFVEYNVQLLRQHLKEKGNVPLPVILNICLYNGNKPYKGSNSLLSMFSDPELAKSCMFDKFHLVDLYSTSEDELISYKKAAFAAMVLKQDIYRKFNQWFINRISLIVDFLEKRYISYADQAFLYMLQLDDHPDLLETIKKSNPKLKEIAMSVAEKIEQIGEKKGIEKGIQKGIRIGEEKGIRIGEEKGIRIGEEKGIRIGEEKGIRIGEEKGIRIGEEKGKLEIAKSMILRGYPLDDIVVLTGLSRSTVEELI